jgi:hypothetical protein
MRLLNGLILLAGLAVSSLALADHRHGGSHWGVGLYFGPPVMYPYYPHPYYYYPYAYYPPTVVVPAPQEQIYIEKGDDSQPTTGNTSQAGYYWYHCDKPEGYYPYIKECPAGWQQVTPTPPHP